MQELDRYRSAYAHIKGRVAHAVDGRRPTAQAIARALDIAAAARVRNRARALGEAMHAENGVAAGVAAIEHIVAT